jgi:uncharacterized protein
VAERSAAARTRSCGARPWLVGGALLLAALIVAPAVVGSRRGDGGSEVPALPRHNFGDWAGAVPPEWGVWLDDQLRVFELTTPARLVVAIVPAVPAGVPVGDFTMRAAERWRPGLQGASNGLILFVFPRNHRARLEVGYGLEALLPDAAARGLLETHAVPFFRIADYREGIRATMEALRVVITSGPAEVSLSPGGRRPRPSRQLATLGAQLRRDWRQGSWPERGRLGVVVILTVAVLGWSLAMVARLAVAFVRVGTRPRPDGQAPWWRAPPEGAPDLAELRLAGTFLVLALGGLIALSASLGGFGGGGALVAW